MKKVFSIVYLVFSALFLLISLYIYYVANDYVNIKKSSFISNSESNFDLLKKNEGKLPFSFAFISDTENNDNSLWLIKKLLESNIDFLVFVGDIANDSTEEEHKLFCYNISKFNPRIPIFIVPSNHDIKDGEFTRADFEKLYGSVNFSFTYNNCLFIFISNIDQKDVLCQKCLESALSNRSSNIKHTFVFCSTPLRIILNKVFPESPWGGKLDSIIEKYKVDYVISGDYHKHLELTGNNNIKYIVSGSGGAHFAKGDVFGRFQSGTKITIYPLSVMQEIVVNDRRIRFTDNSIRHFIYNKFMPFLKSHFWIVNTLLAFFIINVLFSAYCFIKKIEV